MLNNIFGKLGDLVVKHYKKFIVLWVVLLACFLPFSGSINDVLIYEESGILPDGSDSVVADDLIIEEFPQGQANASVIVVVQDDDITSEDYREFAIELKNAVETSEDIEYLGDVISVYTVYEDYFASFAKGLNEGIYEAEAMVNQSASLIYGTASYSALTWEGVNATSNLVFGIPAMHVSNWALTNSSNTVAQRDAEAYAITDASLPFYFTAIGANASTQAMLTAYWGMFAASWDATAANTALAADPVARSSAAVGGALPGLMAMVSDQEAAGLMAAVAGNFTINDFGSATTQSGLVYQMITPMLVAQAPADYAPMASGWCDVFFASWNATFADTSFATATPNERAQAAIDVSIPTFFSGLGLGETEAQMALQIASSVNMDNWDDAGTIHNISLTLVSSSGVDQALVEEVYLLGPEPSLEAIDAFALEMLDSGTYASYPSKLPDEIVGNFISDDDTTMIISISFIRDGNFEDADGNTPIGENVKVVRELVEDVKADGGWTFDTWVTGDTALSKDQAEAQNEGIETIVTIILLFGLTAGFFRSIVAPFVSVGTMATALGMSQAIIYFFFMNSVNGVHYVAVSIMMVVLLGAGTDYSIFILSRYREERQLGHDRETAVKQSIEWAGESVTTSGIAVIIAFLALTVSAWPLITTVGWAVSVGVFLALLMALTLVPSILMIFGNRLFWPSGKEGKEAKPEPEPKKNTYFTRSAKFSIKHAKAILLVAIIISVPATYLFATSSTSFDFIEVMPSSDAKDGMMAITDSFGAGTVMPTSVLLVFPDDVIANGNFTSRADDIELASATVRAMDGVAQVYSPTRPQGMTLDVNNMTELERGLSLAYVGASNRSVKLEVIFQDLPLSENALDRIELIRAELESLNLGVEGIYIGGPSAQMDEIEATLNADFPIMGTLVIIGILVVLILVLGSILIPLEAILTVAMSIAWTLAACVFVFTHILGQTMLWIIPLILFIILMGLGMDYNIFIITRIREEVLKGKSDEEAIITALERTGGIITACGIIMAGAFGALMLSQMGMLKQMGFALMFAILIDALVVRTYLVPALMILGKKWNWWAPGPLGRVNARKENDSENNNN